ncbi:probable U4/U6.U5 tri-snRNP-associated protein 1 at N-terminal half [Coccomyxa sp. Obi]|nr:probable U4/U6.U5 tri-snRNP-associated protein 1 at N-terminal half [Coccomyxa sp. Obi]
MGRHDDEDGEVRKEKKEKSKHKHKDKDSHKEKSHKHKEKREKKDDTVLAKSEAEQEADVANGLPLPPRSGENGTGNETDVQGVGKEEVRKSTDDRHGRQPDGASKEKSERQPKEKESTRDKSRQSDKDRDSRREKDGDRHRQKDRDREEGSRRSEKETRKDREDERDRDERRRHDKDRDRRKDDRDTDVKEDSHRRERREKDREERTRAEKLGEPEKDGRSAAAASVSVAADPEGDYMEEDLPGLPPAAAGEAASAEEPFAKDIKPQVQESGGEISMSIEETNRVRISLGLKPLSLETEKEQRQKEAAAREAKRAEEEKEAKAAELAEKVKSLREKRLEQEQLRKVKTLGAASEDVDDLAAWVTKSRALEEKAKAEARAKALKQARMLEEQDDEFEDSDEKGGAGAPLRNAKELAGMKVKHNAEELNEGETVILTLADRNILDDKGDLDDEADELENALVIEQKKREKARRAAVKNKPLFEEDGKQRGMLDKYDEEEDDAGMEIDETGAVNDEKARKQAEIRAKLAAAQQSAASTAQPSYDARSEYFTKEEMAELFKPKKKKTKKKLRKKDAMEDLSFLEAEAEAAAAAGVTDHGSRGSRAGPAETAEAKREREAAIKEERYKAALEKANYASLVLKEDAGQEEEGTLGEDEDELQEVLARARRAAAAKKEEEAAAAEGPSVARIAEEAARRRAAEEAQRAADAAAGEDMMFTETAEFARGIQIEAAKEPAAKESSSHMGIDDDVQEHQPKVAPKAEPTQDAHWGSWVAASADADKDADADMEDADEDEGAATAELLKESVTHEKVVGKGLGATLALLHERGELNDTIQWAGRNNDVMAAQHLTRSGQLKDVYSGGRAASALDEKIERALTQRDEFGNIMTPKERFRNLCYGFHGIFPSKNKQDKRFKKIAEEREKMKRALGAGDGEDNTVARMHAVQEQTATPYLVLSGKVKPGQSSDPTSGFATVEREPVALTPVLGGGQTPLTGNRKVEAMLGVKRPRDGDASMAPPPPRKPKS